MQRDIVLQAQAGDHEAFSTLAAAAISRLHRTARLIVRDDDRASDAVQDALTTAWLDIRAVRDPDRFDAWLHRLLVRACYRVAGRERRHQVARIDVAVFDLEGPSDAGRELAVRDQLDRGFRRLTSDQRAVLVVHHYLGLPDAEAAHALSIPSGRKQGADALPSAADQPHPVLPPTATPGDVRVKAGCGERASDYGAATPHGAVIVFESIEWS